MKSILVFAPHNDDHALAMGGTLAIYKKRGYKVITLVASHGEMSHPHLKPEVIKKRRIKEAERADRIYGGNGKVSFMGLREFNFKKDFTQKRREELKKLLTRAKPEKIFLPAANDVHGDHKALHKILLPFLKRLNLKSELYLYYVYPSLNHPVAPRLVMDVSAAYTTKLEALHAFRSQINIFSHTITNNFLYLFTIVRDAYNGFFNGTRFAEIFYKVK